MLLASVPCRYSVDAHLRRREGGGPSYRPMGDNVSRRELEEEMFAIRGMRHVFRVKRDIGLQGWVTVLNPIMHRGYPPQFALTLTPDLLEPTTRHPPVALTPEASAAKANGWW